MKGDIEKAIEDILINHLKIVGDDETPYQSYTGTLAQLVEEITEAVWDEIPYQD